MEFSRYPLDTHICQFKLSSCKEEGCVCVVFFQIFHVFQTVTMWSWWRSMGGSRTTSPRSGTSPSTPTSGRLISAAESSWGTRVSGEHDNVFRTSKYENREASVLIRAAELWRLAVTHPLNWNQSFAFSHPVSKKCNLFILDIRKQKKRKHHKCIIEFLHSHFRYEVEVFHFLISAF